MYAKIEILLIVSLLIYFKMWVRYLLVECSITCCAAGC